MNDTTVTYIPDTNALVDGWQLPAGGQVMLLDEVLCELDALSKRRGSVRSKARAAIRTLDALVTTRPDRVQLAVDTCQEDADDALVEVVRYQTRGPGPYVVVTLDRLLTVRIRAILASASGRPEGGGPVTVDAPFVGAVDLPATQDTPGDPCAWEETSAGVEYMWGEYGALASPATAGPPAYGTVTCPQGNSAPVWFRDGHFTLIPAHQSFGYITPGDLRQRAATAAMMDHDVTLVALTGAAGTGKTALALAVAASAANAGTYDTIQVVRPMVTIDGGAGYLPGTLEEKYAPFAKVVYDTLLDVDPKFDPQRPPLYELKIGPVSYMRGQNITKTLLVVDEAQNLSARELKAVLTRAGEGTQVVLTGDPAQVDRSDLNEETCGLTKVIQAFEDYPGFRHVHLTKNYRGPLAKAAGERL